MLPNFQHALPKANPRSFTHGSFPAFVDEKQPPQRRQPFASLLRQQAAYSLELILPDDLIEIFKQKVMEFDSTRYAKVVMSLGEILSGDFFTSYIKAGNIMMISEGRRGLDNRFELFDGVLRIEVDKATYERAGLTGKAISDGGVKHTKSRFVIEADMRQPSMLHGKRGFERIKWACRNVFNQSLTWLFYDHASQTTESSVTAPIEQHHPRWFTLKPSYLRVTKVRVPNIVSGTSSTAPATISEDGYFLSDLEEWTSLVALQSPRIHANDKADPFICRYSFPSEEDNVDMQHLERSTTVANLTNVSWTGFIPSSFVLRTLLVAKRASKGHGWWLMRSSGLRREKDTVTIVQRSKQEKELAECFCWHNST